MSFCRSCWNYVQFCDCVFSFEENLHLVTDLPPEIQKDKGPCVSIWPHGMRDRSRSPAEISGTNKAHTKTNEVWQTRRYDWTDGLKRPSVEYWPHTHYHEGIKSSLYVVEIVMKFADGSIDYGVAYFERPPLMDDVRNAVATGALVKVFDTIDERNETIPYKDEGGKNEGEKTWKSTGIYQGLYSDRIVKGERTSNPTKDPEDNDDDDMSVSSNGSGNTRPPPTVNPPPGVVFPFEMVVRPVRWCMANIPFDQSGTTVKALSASLRRGADAAFPVFATESSAVNLANDMISTIEVNGNALVGARGRIGILTFVRDAKDMQPRTITWGDARGNLGGSVIKMNDTVISCRPGGNISYTYTPKVVGMTVHVIDLQLIERPTTTSPNGNAFVEISTSIGAVPWPRVDVNIITPTRTINWIGEPSVPLKREANTYILTHLMENRNKFHDVVYGDVKVYSRMILYAGHVQQSLTEGAFRLPDGTAEIAQSANVWNMAFPEFYEYGTSNAVPIAQLGNKALDFQQHRINFRNNAGNQGMSIALLSMTAFLQPTTLDDLTLRDSSPEPPESSEQFDSQLQELN